MKISTVVLFPEIARYIDTDPLIKVRKLASYTSRVERRFQAAWRKRKRGKRGSGG
jgi:hypothetical protein